MREFTSTEIYKAVQLARYCTGPYVTETEGEAMKWASYILPDLMLKCPRLHGDDYLEELARIMFDAGRMLGKREERERRAARAAQEGKNVTHD